MNERLFTLFETLFLSKANQTSYIKPKEDGNGTFLLTMHQALKVTADILQVFCNWKEKN